MYSATSSTAPGVREEAAVQVHRQRLRDFASHGDAARAGVVYVGANDGMLHAFNGATGDEQWAYIPTMVMPSVQAGRRRYAEPSPFYVDGSPVRWATPT